MAVPFFGKAQNTPYGATPIKTCTQPFRVTRKSKIFSPRKSAKTSEFLLRNKRKFFCEFTLDLRLFIFEGNQGQHGQQNKAAVAQHIHPAQGLGQRRRGKATASDVDAAQNIQHNGAGKNNQ